MYIFSFKINIPGNSNSLYNKQIINQFGVLVSFILGLASWLLVCKCKILLICIKLFKNAIKICYSKWQRVSASGRLHPVDPLPVLRPWTPLGAFRPQAPLCSSEISLKNPLANWLSERLSQKVKWRVLYRKLYHAQVIVRAKQRLSLPVLTDVVFSAAGTATSTMTAATRRMSLSLSVVCDAYYHLAL